METAIIETAIVGVAISAGRTCLAMLAGVVATGLVASGCGPAGDPGQYEPGYQPASALECVALRQALLDDANTIIAAEPLPSSADPRLRLEAGLTSRTLAFLQGGCYRQDGWAGEDGVHLSGDSESDSTHGWVRVWYSPEVAEWLRRGRPQGQVPDQAILVKERFVPLGTANPSTGTFKLVAWQPMIRRVHDARDGWFWAELGQDEARHGEVECQRPPLAWTKADTLRLDDCRPPSSFGQPCLRCHASERDLTFAQLTHLPEVTGGAHGAHQTIYDYRRIWREIDANNPKYDYDAYKNNPAQTYIAPNPDRDAMAHALASADGDFVAQYGLPGDERAPAEDLPRVFDHLVAVAAGQTADTYLTSDQCWGCHSGVAHIAQGRDSASSMLAPDTTPVDDNTRFTDVSPYGEWSASMMGLAGRDPVFRAQREWEANHRQACGADITDLCYRCHGAAGQHQLHDDQPGRKFDHQLVYTLPDSPDGKYGELARDGITCTVCHHIGAQGLGTPASYTGAWVATAADDLQGPYADDVRDEPMKRALGQTPAGAHGRDAVVKSAALCGSCHAVKLPARRVGSCADDHFGYEQATFLEWRDSDYRQNDAFITDEGHDGRTPATCQQCHMWPTFADVPLQKKIASVEDSDFPTANLTGVPDLHADVKLSPRQPFARHQLNGINLFTLSMFAQAPRIFGLDDYDYMSNQYGEPTRLQMAAALDAGRVLAGASAKLDLGAATIDGSDLVFTVTVTNRAGHKLPSGVGFRRAFLEVSVEDASGAALWASGRTNAAGAIIGGDGQVLAHELDGYEPHYQTITSADQVQIYEERNADSDGHMTTSFLGIFETIKDNRLLPSGWKSQFAPTMEDGVVPLGLEPHGVDGDPEYPGDGSAACGCDVVTYRVPLANVANRARLRARLQYQAIPPYYLRDRFSVQLPDAERLYQLASHLDTRAATSAIRGWKLPLAEATRATP